MSLPFAIVISETGEGVLFMTGCNEGELTIAEAVYLLESAKTALITGRRK